jgi:aminomethyltransferase
MTQNNTIKTSLYSEHIKHKAKMIEFAGYYMPVWYSSLKEEHLTVRQSCGLFDISHMGVFKISGQNAEIFLQNISCNNIEKSFKQKMIYSMILNENGGIMDDVTIGKINNDFILVINACNKKKIHDWLVKNSTGDICFTELTQNNSFIAIQGPDTDKILSKVINTDLSPYPRFGLFSFKLHDCECLAMRTGYTGQDGFELIIPNDLVAKLWDELIQNGATPCGLGARDTLRIEAGLPLYGHELSEEITPLMTRYSSWVIDFSKNFIGKEALLKSKDNKDKLKTVGFVMQDRVIPRADYKIIEGGKVTSGTLSPYLDKPIGLALVDSNFSDIDSEINIQIRGKNYAAKVVKLPFI